MAQSTPNQYPVFLSEEQRQRLHDLCRNGRAPAKKIRHAQVLLLSDRYRVGGHKTGGEIAALLGMHLNTVARIRRRFVLEGEAPALERKPRETPPTPSIIDGHVEAHLVALCCSDPPEGRTYWTMQLLAGGPDVALDVWVYKRRLFGQRSSFVPLVNPDAADSVWATRSSVSLISEQPAVPR